MQRTKCNFSVTFFAFLLKRPKPGGLGKLRRQATTLAGTTVGSARAQCRWCVFPLWRRMLNKNI